MCVTCERVRPFVSLYAQYINVVCPPRCMFTYLIETNTVLFDYCAKNGNHIFYLCMKWIFGENGRKFSTDPVLF